MKPHLARIKGQWCLFTVKSTAKWYREKDYTPAGIIIDNANEFIRKWGFRYETMA